MPLADPSSKGVLPECGVVCVCVCVVWCGMCVCVTKCGVVCLCACGVVWYVCVSLSVVWCVCVCVSLSVVTCNNNPLHLKWVVR